MNVADVNKKNVFVSRNECYLLSSHLLNSSSPEKQENNREEQYFQLFLDRSPQG